MNNFVANLELALMRASRKEYKFLELYGKGNVSVFDRVTNYQLFKRNNRCQIFDIPSRSSVCTCGKVLTTGPKVTFERTSDRACDSLSQAMNSYPTTVDHREGLRCNILVITGYKDLGSAMRTLKERGVTVMLLYTGAEEDASWYLRNSATEGFTMSFKENVFYNP